MSDIIKDLSDAELINLAAQFYAVISANLADYGLSTTQATALASTTAALDTSLQTHVAQQASARNATQEKDADRDTLEQLLRSYLRIIKSVPGMTDAKIAALGIPISQAETAPTATRPTATVDTSERLRHTIDFRDEAAPNIKRRPAGAIGCEIFIKIGGAPPVDDKECDFLTLDTNTPYLAQFNGADAGKTAHYMLRWRLKDGTSPWSTTISATITG